MLNCYGILLRLWPCAANELGLSDLTLRKPLPIWTYVHGGDLARTQGSEERLLQALGGLSALTRLLQMDLSHLYVKLHAQE